MKLVFASNNAHKLEEVRAKLPHKFEILSLKDVLGDVDIIEDGSTLEENAVIKARYVYNKTGLNCFADDTGLEIAALSGEPGVYSARYAGADCSFDDNMNKVLRNLEGTTNRSAKFRTVVCLIIAGKESLFAGEVDGVMTKEKRGDDGFGYDPIFLPNGFSESFAEMSLEEKNKISHRGRAVEKLVSALSQLA
jgi:XTP/dITP diphosphohydrolase